MQLVVTTVVMVPVTYFLAAAFLPDRWEAHVLFFCLVVFKTKKMLLVELGEPKKKKELSKTINLSKTVGGLSFGPLTDGAPSLR